MDQGHSVVWGQLLQLHSPVDDLKQSHPDLANRFTLLSKQLEGAAIRDALKPTSQDLNYHELANERDKLIERIRSQDGFDRFLLPRTFSQLRAAAHDGSVICINVSKSRCDALILKAGLRGIHHVPLENFSAQFAYALYLNLTRFLRSGGRNICTTPTTPRESGHVGTDADNSRAETVFERALRKASTSSDGEGRAVEFASVIADVDPEMEFQSILAHLWQRVVKPIVDELSFSESEKRPEEKLNRVRWCTTGYLTFLPIHAAGLYGDKAFAGSKVSDILVTSYAPTLSSLIPDPRATTPQNHQVLAVAFPKESRLPGTVRELDCIVNRVGAPHVKKLVESEATLENVVAGLEESSFVHFACHGVQHPTSPNESAILLAKSSRVTLSHLRRLALPHGRLAFLSACQTATGDEMLVREAVHLAAGMLSVGYRGVIGTMWSIMDSDAPVVADEVYAELFKGPEPDAALAALALHRAIQRLIRESDGKKSFFEWVPFIHIGK